MLTDSQFGPFWEYSLGMRLDSDDEAMYLLGLPRRELMCEAIARWHLLTQIAAEMYRILSREEQFDPARHRHVATQLRAYEDMLDIPDQDAAR